MTDDGAGTLPELLHRRALADPNAVAVLVPGGATLTYLEWQQRSDAAAAGMCSRGIRSGDRVILMFGLASWTDYAVGYQAVLKAGGVAVPLPVTLTEVEVTRLAADCAASGVVVAPGLRPPGGPSWAASLAELENSGAHRSLDAPPGWPDPAEILYVSRGLAAPLRRLRSHADLVAGPGALAVIQGGEPRTLLHACPIGCELAQLVLGLSLVSGPAQALAVPTRCFDPDRFSTVVSRHGVETLGLSPLMGRLLLESGALSRHDLSTVRCLLVAPGGPPAWLLSGLANLIRGAAVALGLRRCGRTTSVFLHDLSHPGALGRPALPAQLSIYDEEGRDSGRGIGSVWIAGSPTGETGYMEGDGFLYLLAPCDRVVRWAGTNVAAREVEEVLGSHPAVADVSVVGLPHDDAAERLVGAVVLRPATSPPAPQELIEEVKKRLGPAKAPTDVVVVQEIPRNNRGVVLRRRLRQRLAALPVTTSSTPATPTEEMVALAWQRVIGPQELGSDDDFFERGGDELAATRALAVVEDAVSVRVPLRGFLARSTVAGLASSVDSLLDQAGRGSSSVAPVATSQEGMLWHEQFAPGCQNLPALGRRYRGALDVGALERALGEIVRRHEPLRTSFEVRDGRSVQVVHPPVPLRLDIRDLTALPSTERDDEVARAVAEEGSRPFDLTREPLFSPSLVRLGPDDHVLIFRVHHSVYDDWSVGPFRRELSALYTAFATGGPSPLADPPLGFADFARRQRQALAGERGLAELSYWRAALAGAPFVTQLPIGDPALPAGSPQGAPEPVSVVVPPELHRAIRELARRERSTVFMTMLAAFGVLVHGHTGQDDLLIASVVANRNRTELEGLIGCFTKKIPVRLRIAGEDTFPQVLAGARGALLGALSHQDLPFETVLQESIGAAAAARGLVPHVGVMFQGVTPKAQELVLPGLTTTGLGTGATARRGHFMAAEDDDPGRTPRPVWGGGLYQGTFLILSMAETPDGLSLHARGAFHPPAVERLLASFQVLLDDLVARPDAPISELKVLGEQERAVLAAPDDTAPGGRVVDIGGFRVDAARIEAVLSRCPDVDQVAVEVSSEEAGYPRLIAYVAAAKGASVSLPHLRAFLWRDLPGYAWPSEVVVVESLPVHQRRDVEQAVPASAAAGTCPYVAPTTNEEVALSSAWAAALGVERISVKENYWQEFSFLAALDRMREEGMAVESHHVTRYRTIEMLAAALAAERLRDDSGSTGQEQRSVAPNPDSRTTAQP